MKEYEIIIETINPCGGDRHSQQEIVEAKIESPEAFVKEKGRFLEILSNKEDFRSLIRLRIPMAES
mgnify:CR=1 FL=1